MTMSFPELLSFHRTRLELSQAAVADLLQTPLRTYWGWESGRNAPNKITQQVAVATLESLRSDFVPTEAKRGRSVNTDAIVQQVAQA